MSIRYGVADRSCLARNPQDLKSNPKFFLSWTLNWNQFTSFLFRHFQSTTFLFIGYLNIIDWSCLFSCSTCARSCEPLCAFVDFTILGLPCYFLGEAQACSVYIGTNCISPFASSVQTTFLFLFLIVCHLYFFSFGHKDAIFCIKDLGEWWVYSVFLYMGSMTWTLPHSIVIYASYDDFCSLLKR